jgi:hypothetical protein
VKLSDCATARKVRNSSGAYIGDPPDANDSSHNVIRLIVVIELDDEEREVETGRTRRIRTQDDT